jgi:hypothetical protein
MKPTGHPIRKLVLLGCHDQLHAVGAQLGYAVPQGWLPAAVEYLYQYYAEDRFRGQELTLTVGYQFF